MDVQQVSQVDPLGAAEQRQRMAELLRQGNQQPQQQSKGGGDILSALAPLAGGLVKGLGGAFGGSGGGSNNPANVITPDFQSGNYKAPEFMQGFNSSMFKGIL